MDSKFGVRYPLTRNIYIYDSERNTLSQGNRAAVESLIKDRPQEIRHWVQLAKGTFIETAILTLSPRLNYLFLK